MIFVLKVCVKVQIIKIDIRDTGGVLDLAWNIHSILDALYRHLLEFHDVLRQSACLITKDVVDHA